MSSLFLSDVFSVSNICLLSIIFVKSFRKRITYYPEAMLMYLFEGDASLERRFVADCKVIDNITPLGANIDIQICNLIKKNYKYASFPK